jgi:hypothetical protein
MNMSQITTQKGKDGDPDRKRKCFYFDNNNEKPILAAGVLFIKEENGKKLVLMQKVLEKDGREIYSDFGGKIDLDDRTAIETIARELGEELNYAFYEMKKDKKIYLDSTKLKKNIQENIIKKIYQERAKYFVIIAKFPENIEIDVDVIGDFEKLDKINRTVEWITYDQFLKEYSGGKDKASRIHPRLWGNQIMDFFGHNQKIKKFGFTKVKKDKSS